MVAGIAYGCDLCINGANTTRTKNSGRAPTEPYVLRQRRFAVYPMWIYVDTDPHYSLLPPIFTHRRHQPISHRSNSCANADCNGCSDMGDMNCNCGGGDFGDAGAILLVLAIIVAVIFVVVGAIAFAIVATLVLQRVLQRSLRRVANRHIVLRDQVVDLAPLSVEERAMILASAPSAPGPADTNSVVTPRAAYMPYNASEAGGKKRNSSL